MTALRVKAEREENPIPKATVIRVLLPLRQARVAGGTDRAASGLCQPGSLCARDVQHVKATSVCNWSDYQPDSTRSEWASSCRAQVFDKLTRPGDVLSGSGE